MVDCVCVHVFTYRQVEKTKMQQIYDTITSIEGEMDAGMRRVGETVRSVEQAMKLEVRAAVDGVGDKVNIEVDRIRAEAADGIDLLGDGHAAQLGGDPCADPAADQPLPWAPLRSSAAERITGE